MIQVVSARTSYRGTGFLLTSKAFFQETGEEDIVTVTLI